LLHLVGTLNKASSLLYFAFAGSGRVGIVAGAGVGIMIAFGKENVVFGLSSFSFEVLPFQSVLRAWHLLDQ